MKVGLIAQNHRTGIGNQTWDFARFMKPDKVLVTDLTKLHAQNSRNAKKVEATDWFSDYDRMTVDGIPNEEACRWLLEGIDVLFVVETPLNWSVFKMARQMGVKTVLQYNFEFLEYFIRPVPKPDLFLAPSLWNIERVKNFGQVQYLPVPIATDRLKRREITHANKFLHITGHRAHLDRNGSEIVEAAAMNSGLDIVIKDQSKEEVPNYWDLYNEGDVLLIPRRYGGLSLQIQEAAARGIPSVVTRYDPYAGEPCGIAIPAPVHATARLRTSIQIHSATPGGLSQKLYELNGLDITEKSEQTYQWAQQRSWEAMKPKYLQVFERLCEQ